VVERFGRLRAVLGPGINFIVPFLDRVAHKVSVLERQLPTASQDAITADNVLVRVETSVFYRITEPEKTVYRIRDVDGAISTTVAGIVRSEIGKLELDQVQSNRADLIQKVREQVATMVEDWGIEVTRAEILDVSLDDATRAAMLQQLNAERARRAQVTEAEGKKRAAWELLALVNEQVWLANLRSGKANRTKVMAIWRTPGYPDYHWIGQPNLDQRFGQGFTSKLRGAILSWRPLNPEQKAVLQLFGAQQFTPVDSKAYAPIERVGRQLGKIR
jgi:regulator of protease activity HflC (stomatin/prohibitin superfamily)